MEKSELEGGMMEKKLGIGKELSPVGGRSEEVVDLKEYPMVL